jgi:hypothetical protein
MVRKVFEDAMEEIRILQEIIGRNEGFAFQVRGWLLALLGAFVAVLFSDKSQLTPIIFVAIGWSLAFLLSMVEASIRITIRQSICRVGLIEEQLRKSSAYDGPSISRTLSENDDPDLSLSSYLNEARVMGFRTFYLALLLAVCVMGYAGSAA